MRLPLLFLLACTLLAAAIPAATAAPTTSLDVTGKSVRFFYNRFIVTADGTVRVRLSDGTILTGETFTMDLKLNRFLIAGDVHVDGPAIHAAGAALAGYPDLDRTYFLPVPGSEAPQRYTYFGQNWSDPHPDREQPGDAFNFPDLTGERPYIKAYGARIIPKTNVLFDRPQIYTAGVYVPLPRYVVMFSANSHFFENGFVGARADVGLPFNGSDHSLTALHIRNDAVNGTYLAFDQHFVWNDDYIVASVDPLTQQERQFNFIAYDRFNPHLEARLFAQESAAQAGLINRPTNAAAFTEVQVNAALRHSGISYTQDNYYQYLLGFPPQPNDAIFTATYDPRWREHPTQASLVWAGFENHAFSKATPILFRLRSGLGFAHDQFGEGGYPNLQPGPPDSIYHFVGGTLYTPAIRVGLGYSLSAAYDRQREWFNTPHSIDSADTRVSLSKQYGQRHINTYLAYDVRQTGDYWGSQQLAAYPVGTLGCGDVCTNQFGTFSGQNAFRGFATSRGLTAAAVFTPTQFFTVALSLAHFDDFPKPVPGIYGQPPNQFSADVRVRVSHQILLDVSRANYFNFANERWTPQFGIQFSP